MVADVLKRVGLRGERRQVKKWQYLATLVHLKTAKAGYCQCAKGVMRQLAGCAAGLTIAPVSTL
ncbi:hypothetical protein [Comamonas serinivorans]|uniref:hypothetical protein n=1 Tax=Comamonas serinivorans TaxID=1082851 RepID=UPI0012FBD095|nr:hypothetical protein [Comamonas serinivorans]